MKNIFLFIGLGLLMSGCETKDPDIYKCLRYDYDASGIYFVMIIDKKRKTLSRFSEEGMMLLPTPREVSYTEEDNFIKAEEIVELSAVNKTGIFREIRLDKISGSLSLTEYNGITNDDPKSKKSKYRCEKAVDRTS